MNAIFICVIVLDKMCFHMFNLCWFKHKKIFKCFRCFRKVFCFYKKWKFQKQCCLVLATQLRVIQVACHSHELAGQFWWLVREWKVQSRGVHKDFHGSACNFLASETSSREKHLANFFKTFGLKCFGGCLGDWLVTCINREKCVFCVLKTVFKTFSVFPSNFCDCSLSSPFLSLKHSMSHFKKHLFLHHSFSNLQEKGMGFLCLTSFFMFLMYFSWFCECVVAIMLWKISCSYEGLLYLGECSLIES